MPSIESIPGIEALWARTLGDPRVTIAVLDGPVDGGHPCFAGADLERCQGYWQTSAAVHDDYRTHATHVASVIFGQHKSEVKGIAPRCRGINIAVALDEQSTQCPLALTRGVDMARNCGANILHIAPCIQTSNGKGDDLLGRSIRLCIANNILVIAPAGNDNGECWCLPAAFPDVLAVGALNDKGIPFKFSNWGGAYQNQGLVAPGENILGAEPGGITGRRKGTSCAAPLVTGVAALLMSMQLEKGEEPDAHCIRDVLLKSAQSCQSSDTGEPARCLAGKLNIPGAVQLLCDPRFARYRQAGATRSRRAAVQTGVFPRPPVS